MYYIHKGKEIVLHAFSLDSDDGKIQENLKKNLTVSEVWEALEFLEMLVNKSKNFGEQNNFKI